MAVVCDITPSRFDSPAQITSPSDILLVTPSDTDELARVTKGLSWAVDGDIVVVTLAGETRTIASGSLNTKTQHSMAIKQVKSTGTHATGIIAWV